MLTKELHLNKLLKLVKKKIKEAKKNNRTRCILIFNDEDLNGVDIDLLRESIINEGFSTPREVYFSSSSKVIKISWGRINV